MDPVKVRSCLEWRIAAAGTGKNVNLDDLRSEGGGVRQRKANRLLRGDEWVIGAMLVKEARRGRRRHAAEMGGRARNSCQIKHGVNCRVQRIAFG